MTKKEQAKDEAEDTKPAEHTHSVADPAPEVLGEVDQNVRVVDDGASRPISHEPPRPTPDPERITWRTGLLDVPEDIYHVAHNMFEADKAHVAKVVRAALDPEDNSVPESAVVAESSQDGVTRKDLLTGLKSRLDAQDEASENADSEDTKSEDDDDDGKTLDSE